MKTNILALALLMPLLAINNLNATNNNNDEHEATESAKNMNLEEGLRQARRYLAYDNTNTSATGNSSNGPTAWSAKNIGIGALGLIATYVAAMEWHERNYTCGRHIPSQAAESTFKIVGSAAASYAALYLWHRYTNPVVLGNHRCSDLAGMCMSEMLSLDPYELFEAIQRCRSSFFGDEPMLYSKHTQIAYAFQEAPSELAVYPSELFIIDMLDRGAQIPASVILKHAERTRRQVYTHAGASIIPCASDDFLNDPVHTLCSYFKAGKLDDNQRNRFCGQLRNFELDDNQTNHLCDQLGAFKQAYKNTLNREQK